MELKTIGRLIMRTWPYYRPQLKHLITYASLNALMGTFLLVGALIGNDLINNKVLLGERVQPLQGIFLLLDASLVTTGVEDEVLLTDEQRRTVRNRLLIWVGIFTGLLMASFMGVGYYMAWIYQRINQQLRVAMLEQAENLSLRYHSHARTGDAIYRVYQDSATITNVLQLLILTPLRAISWLLFSVVTISFFSPWLGLMCLLTAIPVAWLGVWFTPRLQNRARRARELNSNLTSSIQEIFSAIKLVKANGSEGVVLKQFNEDSTRALDAAYRFRAEIVFLSTAVVVLATATLLVAEYLMASWTIDEKATYLGAVVFLLGFTAWNLGAFQSASSTTSQAAEQSRDLISLWAGAQDLSVGLDRAFFLLDLQPEVVEKTQTLPFPGPLRDVSWRGVRFSYDADQSVLDGVSLTANVGTITAVVGATGSGKSTLMSLLLRLYDPDAGDIFINDVNIKDLGLADLRANVSIALQRNVLFATSVADNIGYASKQATRETIAQAAVVACADGFIEAMPHGYDTELGERGGKLSSGQRQRLSIARAIVRDTPILILDEPTASLDAETEHQVLENLRQWGEQRIVFIITHRLSTIKNADQIALIAEGKVVELGSHDELMALQASRYRDFVNAEVGAAAGGDPA